MIGWRPYLLVALAIVLLAGVGFDLSATGRHSRSCASADTLYRARDFADARVGYDAVLESDPASRCATTGSEKAISGECVQAQRIAATDPAEARSRLLAVAEAQPPPGPGSCVWRRLAVLAAGQSG
jgi:hypothetical protein